jgi:hypothetical protein
VILMQQLLQQAASGAIPLLLHHLLLLDLVVPAQLQLQLLQPQRSLRGGGAGVRRAAALRRIRHASHVRRARQNGVQACDPKQPIVSSRRRTFVRKEILAERARPMLGVHAGCARARCGLQRETGASFDDVLQRGQGATGARNGRTPQLMPTGHRPRHGRIPCLHHHRC